MSNQFQQALTCLHVLRQCDKTILPANRSLDYWYRSWLLPKRDSITPLTMLLPITFLIEVLIMHICTHKHDWTQQKVYIRFLQQRSYLFSDWQGKPGFAYPQTFLEPDLCLFLQVLWWHRVFVYPANTHDLSALSSCFLSTARNEEAGWPTQPATGRFSLQEREVSVQSFCGFFFFSRLCGIDMEV